MNTTKNTEPSIIKSAFATLIILSLCSAAFNLFNKIVGTPTNTWIYGLHGAALGGILVLGWGILSACHHYSTARQQRAKGNTPRALRPLVALAACASAIYVVCARLYALSLFSWLFQPLQR
jgi:hypothetical protein